MSDAGFAVQMLDVSPDPDAGLPVVEEIVGILNPPPPPSCRWGCGETMRPVTKHGAFVCRKCDAWQFLAFWNGDWVEAEDIPYLRARASINPSTFGPMPILNNDQAPASCIETQGEWVPRSTGGKGGRRVVAFKPDESYHGGFAEVLVAEVFGGVMPDGGSHGPWSQPAGDETARAEMEANAALISSAKDFRSALQKIADANLKRCSAGWLKQTAVEALSSAAEKAALPDGGRKP